MKNTIVVLGILAATGLALFDAPGVRASEFRPSSTRVSEESWTDVNYTGTDEDGNEEEVKPGAEGSDS